MKIRISLSVLVLLFITPFMTAANAQNERLEQLITHFQDKGTDIRPLLNDDRFAHVDRITKKFTRSAEKRIESLDDYKKIIGFDHKARKSMDFYNVYKNDLAAAEKEYGIPKEVIVAIIGVESAYGANRGSYNPFNVYVSMYVEDYRSKFALTQLEELLEWTERNEVDVHTLVSSYAGAMSFAQFIPSSLNRWWVGKDLYYMPNNIRSVANYLAYFKNKTGSLETAVLRYNPSSLYQQAVLSLADEVKSRSNSE